MTLQNKFIQFGRQEKALLAVNFYNFETLSAILKVASAQDTSIILQSTKSTIDYLGLKVTAELARAAIGVIDFFQKYRDRIIYGTDIINVGVGQPRRTINPPSDKKTCFLIPDLCSSRPILRLLPYPPKPADKEGVTLFIDSSNFQTTNQ